MVAKRCLSRACVAWIKTLLIAVMVQQPSDGKVFGQELLGKDVSWPQFRGTEFNPTAERAGLPSKWSSTECIKWSLDIPGRGWSSPIVVEGKVYLTTVTTVGESKEPQTGTDYSNAYVAELMQQGLSEEEVERRVMERDFELPDQVSLNYYLLCVDLATGEELWKREYHAGKPPGGRHRKNSFASETSVTDGKSLYVYATHLGLFAFDLSGQPLWKTDLPEYPTYMEFGTGTSPVLLDDKLIIVDDNQEKSSISAFSTHDGSLVWETSRTVPDNYPAQMPKSGWATPYIWRNSIRTEIVTLMPGAAISYDGDGNELWRLTDTTPAPSASSFAVGDLLILNGGKSKPIYGVRPGASGDIAPASSRELGESIAWIQPRAGTYIPTPVAYQNALYVLQDNGVVSRIDLETGEVDFKARLSSPNGADFTASPWAYDGKVFCASEQGDTFVFEAAKEYKPLHVNALEELVMATPAMVGNTLLLRTAKKLYAIHNAG